MRSDQKSSFWGAAPFRHMQNDVVSSSLYMPLTKSIACCGFLKIIPLWTLFENSRSNEDLNAFGPVPWTRGPCSRACLPARRGSFVLRPSHLCRTPESVIDVRPTMDTRRIPGARARRSLKYLGIRGFRACRWARPRLLPFSKKSLQEVSRTYPGPEFDDTERPAEA